ncbi:hypothetical protein H7849_04345 [Alloacidobacterium dinghuense]|uniref:Nucleotidyltransferase family protein n=1 Tax=Alloacidobacterium dinghuense TaxID=2763107 RepID=A0A7G8BKY6_9BACT|nr:hypothetical protein [Alloacidobacterium dinghuense]QNI33206.1 hypothetical protein H7849_04345 [Alloacidobacterium dinghuense]
MPNQSAPRLSNESMILLSKLLLSRRDKDDSLSHAITNISRNEFGDLLYLANTNHVIVRGLEVLFRLTCHARDDVRSEWAATALSAEHARIKNATSFLHEICGAFERESLDVTVIKSLDHWPDLGSDLDLYTSADSETVSRLMKKRFRAQIAPRSWGDRLACKWNFLIPGLPEAVEIHMGRLGQTGEQVRIASQVPRRARVIQIEDLTFHVSAISDRIMISTLQRMYRHFYFRLCDIVDSAGLVESGAIDYDDLCASAGAAGIWEGVATYLAIVSDYVRQYRGTGLDLPESVSTAARFGGAEVYFARDFLRVPIMPQSASLYGSQLAGLLRKRELNNSARLGLLPWLATAAVVGQKLTGSDKGIW